MRVSKSFAESLMDAVMQGRVPGMQFKRNWDILANMGQTWDAITNIVGDHLKSVREVAHEEGIRAAQDHARERDKAIAERARTAERNRIADALDAESGNYDLADKPSVWVLRFAERLRKGEV